MSPYDDIDIDRTNWYQLFTQLIDELENAKNSDKVADIQKNIESSIEIVQEIQKIADETVPTAYQNSLKELQTDISETYEQLDHELSDQYQLNKKLEELINDAQYIRDNSLEPSQKLDVVRGRAIELVERLESKESDINALESELSEYLSDISEEKDSIQEAKEEANQLEDQARNLITRTVGGTIGEEFDARKEDIAKTLWGWLAASILSIGFLLWFSYRLFIDLTQTGTGGVTDFSKVALLLPISVAVWFSVSNYSRQKRLMREYQFKATIGFSLESFAEVLRKDLPEEEHAKIGQFMIDSMEKIYSNPQQNIEDGNSGGDNALSISQRAIDRFMQGLGGNN